MADKFKGESRDARLSNKNVMRKTNEEVLRKTYENEAYAKCKPEFSAFGDCGKYCVEFHLLFGAGVILSVCVISSQRKWIAGCTVMS